jgi:hypothetical protein
MAKMDLDALQNSAEKLVALLKERESGCMSWHMMLNSLLNDIRFEIDGIESCVPEVRRRAAEEQARASR